VRLAREATAVDEAFFVAREIRRLMLDEPRLRPGDFAVLLRSTTALSAPFEDAIRALDLPYEVRGVGALARNEVVRFLVAYLRAVHQPEEPESLERLLASGLSGVGHRTAGRLRRYAIEEGRAFTKVVRRLLYWLHDGDPATYPLPWGGDDAEPTAAASAPDFAQYLTAGELGALHEAVSAFYEVCRRARQLPLSALAYHVLIEAGVLGRILALPLAEAERDEVLAELRAALDGFRQLEEVWARLTGSPPR